MMRPVIVTQRTCDAVLGVSRRWFLDYLQAHPEVPRAQLGRQTCVRVDDWLAHVAAHTTTTEAAVSSDREWSPDAVLARRGLRRVG
ncbi:MAG TPA: hypothetical protein PLI95_19560 [Polyangiaceae bacterium]|nr:hypothetical protein [Polyangiaceae bacterium]